MEENKVLVVDDGSQTGKQIAEFLASVDALNAIPKLSDEEIQALYPSKVKLPTGEWMERSDVVFLLKKDPANEKLFRAFGGTVYEQQKSGALKKVAEETKAQRKAKKKIISQYWQIIRKQNKEKLLVPIAQVEALADNNSNEQPNQ